jgi:S1-C subfamily serine protease
MWSTFKSTVVLVCLTFVLGAAPRAALSQTAVLYEEDSVNPHGRSYVGSVAWRTDKVSAGAQQSPELAVIADVEVPARNLAATFSLRRNTDRTLPASHVIEITFKRGDITNVPGILVKSSENTRGVPLKAHAVRVTDGAFLIGLSGSATEKQTNLDLIKTREWFDIPMYYPDGRRGILAIEKGAPGGAIFATVLSDWENKDPPNIAAPPSPESTPPKNRPQGSVGSGFFLTKTGRVLTNSHVVRDCAKIGVRTAGGALQSAQMLARSEADDLAILKADGIVAATATLRTVPSPRSGEAIVVFGFPLSGLLASSGNVTIGNVTALAGLRDDSRQLQISAPIQPGNSGGPVLDMSGNVIGVVVSKLDALRVAGIPQNINFAIKASTAANFLDARGITYAAGQPGKELSVPDIAEHARSISVEVRCER